MTQAPMTPEELKRAALFIPCETKEHLARWVRVYLGIDLPSVTICDDDVTTPPSNSNPMDFLWEFYGKAMDGTDPDYQRVLVYSGRDCFKTLACSIIEILSLFHFRRSVAHMAAIEQQAVKCASYIKRYLQRPILRDYVVGNNKREIEIVYYKSTSSYLSPAEFAKLEDTAPAVAARFEFVTNYIKILVATIASANGDHCPLLVLDETDITPPGPFKEVQMVPSPGERGELPITLMVSSRKSSFGNVQNEIDDAEATGLVIRHWNIVDVTTACPPSRHLPDKPKIPIYYSEKILRAIPQLSYDILPEEEQATYQKAEGYAGCLERCKLFSVCRGRLATKQTGTSQLLKSIDHVTGLFKTYAKDPEIAKAQLMCWQPGSVGLIYPNLSSVTHYLSAAKMAAEITGEEYPDSFTKAELIQLMKARNMAFHSGMDFGFTHNFAVVTGALDGHRLFVVDCIAVAGLELTEKLDLCANQLKPYNSTIYPDPAYPSDIKSFRKAGYRVKNFVKDVHLGINSLRSKLMPSLGGEPEMFFLSGDDGVAYLFKRLSRYHWILDAAGNATDVPDDTDDDAPDAIRYLCQNLFGKATAIRMSVGPNKPATPEQLQDQQQKNKWMAEKISELTGGSSESAPATVRSGGFVFNR